MSRQLRVGGGGGGVHPQLFVKLVFEIAVDRQTRTREQTFEGPDPQPPTGARDANMQPRPYLVNFRIFDQLCQITSTCPKPR